MWRAYLSRGNVSLFLKSKLVHQPDKAHTVRRTVTSIGIHSPIDQTSRQCLKLIAWTSRQCGAYRLDNSVYPPSSYCGRSIGAVQLSRSDKNREQWAKVAHSLWAPDRCRSPCYTDTGPLQLGVLCCDTVSDRALSLHSIHTDYALLIFVYAVKEERVEPKSTLLMVEAFYL